MNIPSVTHHQPLCKVIPSGWRMETSTAASTCPEAHLAYAKVHPLPRGALEGQPCILPRLVDDDWHRRAIYRDRASHRFGQGEGEAASQRPRIDYDRIGPGIWQRLHIDIIGPTHQLTSQRCPIGAEDGNLEEAGTITEAHLADAQLTRCPAVPSKTTRAILFGVPIVTASLSPSAILPVNSTSATVRETEE